MKKPQLAIAALLFIAACLVFYRAVSPPEETETGNVPGFVADTKSGETISGPQSADGTKGFPETVEQIMERDRYLEPKQLDTGTRKRKPYPDRRNLPQDPDAKPESTYPPLTGKQKQQQQNQTDNPQTVSTSFTAITISETGFIPADNMGAAGPTQYVAIANGRIKTFSKATGTADGVINTTTDNFFNSVRNGAGTSDPRIRYDRISQKWFVVIINTSSPNRILIAVSNTSTVTAATTWLFYFINAPSIFYDYPTLGIDNNAVYIGTNDFNTALTVFIGCSGYVVNKAGLIAGSASATLFTLATTASEGPYTPQGVDNFDASATEGYFVGVSTTSYSRLIIRRVTNPGGTPIISGNINITVNTTTNPISVPQTGSVAVLDALDDRLFAACIRNGRLWTSHNIEVNSSGVGTTGGGRNGSRWYELQNLTGVPAVVQSGTIFDNAASNPISYWIPTVMVSGQGHAAFIFSSSGSNARINTATNGRLSGGTLGTTQAVTAITSSTQTYDQAGGPPERWGDYSNISLDPNDDMTMWGVMGFCDGLNSYGVRVTKLLSPPPPALTSASPSSPPPGQPSVNVIITGTPTTGQGFYDPGSGFTSRISASVTGGVTVNSVTYNTPSQVTLNVSTVGALTGSKTVTITNPDGQFVSSSSIFDVPLPVVMSLFTYSLNKRDVLLKWRTEEEINNRGFDIERRAFIGETAGEWSRIGYVEGHGNKSTASDYGFTDPKLNTGKYDYRLKQIDFNGNFERFELGSRVTVGVPMVSELSQNYPNPFNPVTKIDYSISVDGRVSIVVYDVTGRVVADLIDENKTAGYYSAAFDSSALSSGVYFYKISAPGISQVKKMLVMK